MNVVEAALGDPAGQGHLAAFKSDADLAAGTSLLALVSTTGSFAVAGAAAAALALGNLGRAQDGSKFMKFHSCLLLIPLQ